MCGLRWLLERLSLIMRNPQAPESLNIILKKAQLHIYSLGYCCLLFGILILSILFISFVLYQKQQSIFALFGCFHLFEHFRTSLASGRHWECRKMKHGPSLELFSYPFLSWFFFITYLSLTTPCNTYSKQNSHDFNTNFFIHFDWNVILPYMSFCIPYSFLSLSTWNKYWHI